MKKFVAVMVVTSAVLMAGCGSKEVSFDVSNLGGDLNSKITYDEELSLMDVDTASMFLNLSDINIVNSAIYESSGATAEEIVVLECASGEDADKAKTMMQERVDEQKESYVDYVPAEMPKLESAVIDVNGKYAVLSVSGDAALAKEIIDSYMK